MDESTAVAVIRCMAVVTVLLSYLARQASNIVQAIFGWSITSLFGKLPRRAQIRVIGALLLSLAWPLLVLGAFQPKIASWAIAFAPLHQLVGAEVLRGIWIVLALAAPIAIGLLVRAAAPGGKATRGIAALRGYPMALGFFGGFLVITITVPIIKIASILRGWSDEHVYVQPHGDKYDAVLHSLAEACARAGLMPEIRDVAPHMQLATTIMHWFARGAVTTFVPQQLRRVSSDGVQLYQYPADLLLRGEPKKIARVRAMLSRTCLDAQAYLVESDQAKRVQDELVRIHDVLIDRLDHGRVPGEQLASRLRAIFRELRTIDVTFAEWSLLETMARRCERRLIAARAVPYGEFPIDQEPDRMPDIARLANNQTEEATMDNPPDPEHESLDALSMTELVKRTLDDARQLVRAELDHAKQDLRAEAKAAARGGIEIVVAYSSALLALATAVSALAFTVGRGKLALVFALVFAAAAAIVGVIGYRTLPKKPMAPTIDRVEQDVERLKEHLA